MENLISIANIKLCIELPTLKTVYLPLRIYAIFKKLIRYQPMGRRQINYQKQKKYRPNNLTTCSATENILIKPKIHQSLENMCERKCMSVYIYTYSHTCTRMYTHINTYTHKYPKT